MNEFIAYGTKRTRQKTLKAGDTLKSEKGVLYINETSTMDVVEVFTEGSQLDSPGWWWEQEPVGQPAPEPVPLKPSLWTRFWAWVRRRPLPVARLLPPREVKS